MAVYTDSQIVSKGRKYPLQISKTFPDTDENLEALEEDMMFLKEKGIRAAIFLVKKNEEDDGRIVLMREVYNDDVHDEPYNGGIKSYPLLKYVAKKGNRVLADKGIWRYRKKILSKT